MTDSDIPFESGSLWPAIVNRTRRSLDIGALRPIETEQETIVDGGISFDVRVISSLARKAHEANPGVRPPDFNPFLPYEEDLFVANISESHVGILNKFPVADNHLLIVTRAFEEQTFLLTEQDFQAMCACMREFDGLAFYNSGEIAGASQRHKHIQIVPLPLTSDGQATPVEGAIAAADLSSGVGQCPTLPFANAIVRLDDLDALPVTNAASALQDHYHSMLRSMSLMDEPDNTKNYNLLATRSWMMLVPRSREHFEGISINALGFAGELLVMDRNQLSTLRERGPMAALRAVGVLRHPYLSLTT